MKHTRKILSLALALVMALSLCTVTALADVPDVSTWTNLQTAINNASTTATTIELTQNLTGNAPLSIAKNQNITIDLKGFTLDRGLNASSAAQNGYVIENAGTLTITDTSTNKTGTITGGNANWGGAVVCYGTTTLAGGNIIGNKSGGNAGAVLVVGGEGGKFFMTGGKITNNKAVNGGAIVLDDTNAEAEIIGGEIIGNTATYGGAVCNSGKLTIGGTAVIKNNTARNGGAVNNSGILVITGGKITGNKAIRQDNPLDGGCGGAIYSHGADGTPASVKMTGGEITGNQATKYGGGIGNSGYSTIIFGGTAQVKNNTCKIGDAAAKTDNVAIRSKSDTNLISVSTETPLKGKATIGVNVETEGEAFMAAGVAAEFARFFTADDSTKNVEYRDGKFVFVDAPESGLLDGIFELIRFGKFTDDIKAFSIITLILEFIKNIIAAFFG